MIDLERAERVKRFIEGYCTYSAGTKFKGKPFKLLPWQYDDVIVPYFSNVGEDGLRDYRTCYIEIPKKNGKRLALGTPLPTPGGWSTVGDIREGDILFDEQGKQCKVIGLTPIVDDKVCYEVVFSDGERIVADAEHKWAVTELVDTYRAGVRTQYEDTIRTTEEIAQKVSSHGGRCKTFKIKVAKAIKCDWVANLPVPPYTLGAWLGDGDSSNPAITCSEPEILKNIAREGVNLSKRSTPGKKASYGHYGLGKGQGLVGIMRSEGLLNNKHIPGVYLRASISQREKLFNGLMDTDGYCSNRGQCEFSTTKPALRDGFMELARSLGFKPTVKTVRAMLNGRDCGEAYRIIFNAFSDDNVFSLKRHADRLRQRPQKPPRSMFRNIVEVTRVDSVPCRCIAVDSPSHLYLCGKSFIPTHNTELLAALALYFLCADGELGAAVYVAAADREQAGLTYTAAAIMIRANPVLSKKLKCIDSKKRIVYLAKDGFIQVLSAEVETKHGINPSAVLIDELHAHPNDKLYRYLTSGTDIAREQQAVFVTTTAGIYDKNSIWWRQRTHALQVRDGIIPDTTFLPVLYIANVDEDPDDEELWKRTNPSTGYIFDVEKIRKDYMAIKDRPIEFQDFKRFRLNIPIRQLSKWMPMDKWNACNAMPKEETFLRRRCFGGIDLSEKVDLSCFVMLFEPDEDGMIDMVAKFYCPEEGILERSNRDKVPYDIWNKQGYIIATPGATVDYEFILADILHSIKSYRMPEIGYDPWKSTDMRNKIMKEVNPSEDPKHFQMVEVRQGGATLHEPCQDLLVNVINGKLHHGGNPVMDWCMDNLVMKSDSNANFSPDKKTSVERIDGVSATVTAWSRMLFNRKKRRVTSASCLVSK